MLFTFPDKQLILDRWVQCLQPPPFSLAPPRKFYMSTHLIYGFLKWLLVLFTFFKACIVLIKVTCTLLRNQRLLDMHKEESNKSLKILPPENKPHYPLGNFRHLCSSRRVRKRLFTEKGLKFVCYY